MSDALGKSKDPHRVMLVEDDAVYRRSIARVLEDMGYDVHAVTAAEEALVEFDRAGASLVLTDYILPGMNGIDLAERLHEKGCSVPVILLSGLQREEFEGAGTEKSVTAILTKPVDFAMLERTIMASINQAEI